MVFLDASTVIYLVERTPVWGQKAQACVLTLLAAGETLAVSDLVRLECLVGPIQAGDVKLELSFRTFFAAPDLTVFPITGPVCDRTARIRATNGFRPLDSLHLAAAAEHGCTSFLTNDARLSSFRGITMVQIS